MGPGCPHTVIDLDATLRVKFDLCFNKAKSICVRCSTRGDENGLGFKGHILTTPIHDQRGTVISSADLPVGETVKNLDAFIAKIFCQRLTDLWFGLWQQPRPADDGDLDTSASEDLGKFAPDVTTANDKERTRQVL
jgi:hypothetical protein